MTGITQEMKNYIGEFFDDSRITAAKFDEMLKNYGVTGRGAIIEGICLPLLDQSNIGDAVYSYQGKSARKYGNDYATVDRIHREKGLTKYDIDDDGFTRTPGKRDAIH